MGAGGKAVTKLILGTAQFGLNYGISNTGGRIPEEEVARILAFAEARGIAGLDTAAAYGVSEEVIGRVLAGRSHSFEIISKLPSGLAPDELRGSLVSTLRNLKVKSLAGYLAHDSDLLKDEAVRGFMDEAKREGLVAKTGVSVYRPSEVEDLWEAGVELDLVQIPFSVFDQRFRPLFQELKRRGVEIHARSVFLQGLYFLDPDALPDHLQPAEWALRDLRSLAGDSGIPLAHLLLGYVLRECSIDRVVFGVAGLHELQENVKAFDYLEEVGKIKSRLDGLSVEDEMIVLPTNWP